MDWQIGNFALCVTPGSKIENRVVMIVSRPLNYPDKPDVVYRVHPGFPDRNNWDWGAEGRHLRPIPFDIETIEWKPGPFMPDVLVHLRVRKIRSPDSKRVSSFPVRRIRDQGV